MAQRHRLSGDGHIHSFGSQLPLQHGGVDGGFPLFQLCFNLGPDRVCQLAHDRAFLGGQLAHLLEDGGHLTFFAQQLYPQILQRGRGISGIQSRQSTLANLLQLFFHFDSS